MMDAHDEGDICGKSKYVELHIAHKPYVTMNIYFEQP